MIHDLNLDNFVSDFKSYQIISIYHVIYKTFVTVKFSCVIIHKAYGCNQDYAGIKYIKYLKECSMKLNTFSRNNNILDVYDDKYIKVKFNLNDDFPVDKNSKLSTVLILIKSFIENRNKNEYYPQVFLKESLWNLVKQYKKYII